MLRKPLRAFQRGPGHVLLSVEYPRPREDVDHTTCHINHRLASATIRSTVIGGTIDTARNSTVNVPTAEPRGFMDVWPTDELPIRLSNRRYFVGLEDMDREGGGWEKSARSYEMTYVCLERGLF